MLVLGKFAISLLGSGRSHQAAWGQEVPMSAGQVGGKRSCVSEEGGV